MKQVQDIIFKNDYYDGVVIVLSYLNKITINDTKIEVEAGYSLQKLALEACNSGLTGLEFACGIPGCIGASIAMNAGAYNASLEDVVESVEVINDKFEIITMTNEEMDFSYRDSFFKKNKNYIIISATINLEHGNVSEILELINNRRMKRLESQPLEMPSAGSVFRNPEGKHAGALIEKANLKGYKINGAQVSTKHANFIVNTGKAKGDDIVNLIEKVKNDVKKEFECDLVLEQIIVD